MHIVAAAGVATDPLSNAPLHAHVFAGFARSRAGSRDAYNEANAAGAFTAATWDRFPSYKLAPTS